MRHASILNLPVATAKSCAINFNENIKTINKKLRPCRAAGKYSARNLNLTVKIGARGKIVSIDDTV